MTRSMGTLRVCQPSVAITVSGRHRVVVAQPAVEADGHFALAASDDDKGVSAVAGSGGVDPVEEAGPG